MVDWNAALNITGGKCKKSAVIIETSPNGNEFLLTSYRVGHKYSLNVLLPVVMEIPSRIMIFKLQYLLQSLCKIYLKGIPNFTLLLLFPFICKWRANCNVNPLIWEAVLPVAAVTALEGCYNFWTWYLRSRFTYSVMAIIRKPFPTLAPPVKCM